MVKRAAREAARVAARRKMAVNLEDLLDLIDSEDLELAIEYLQARESEWQDYLSSPAS